MKIRLSLVFYICIISNNLFSQNNFNKGYCVDNKNDTIFGYLKKSSNFDNSIIIYKPTIESNDEKTFYPIQINEVIFETGEHLISKQLNIENDSIKSFLTVLIKGKVSLYFLMNPQLKEVYYIESIYGGLRELKIQEQIKKIKEQGRTVKIKNKLYIGELLIAFQDAHWTSSQIEKYSFTKEGLIKAVQDYHFSIATTYENFNFINNLKAKNEFSFSIGISTYIGYSDVLESSFGKNFNLNYNYFPSYLFERYSFGIGYSFTKLHLEIIDKPINEELNYTIHQIPITLNRHFKQDNLRTTTYIGLEYEYLSNNKSSYSNFLIGTNFDYRIKNENYLRIGAYIKVLNSKTIGIQFGYIF